MKKFQSHLNLNTLIIFMISLSILLMVLCLIFDRNQILLSIWLSIVCLAVWIKILDSKEKLFLWDSEFKFFNNSLARKKLYIYRAILFFLLALLYATNIFLKLSPDSLFYPNIWLLILVVLISLFYLFKYRK